MDEQAPQDDTIAALEQEVELLKQEISALKQLVVRGHSARRVHEEDAPTSTPAEEELLRSKRIIQDAQNQLSDIWPHLWDRDKAMPTYIRFGKATATWTSGNTVTLTPVKSMTDSTVTGEANVTAYIISPQDGIPTNPSITSGKVYAFVADPADSTKGVLLPVLMQIQGLLCGATMDTNVISINVEKPLEMSTDGNGNITISIAWVDEEVQDGCDGDGNPIFKTVRVLDKDEICS